MDMGTVSYRLIPACMNIDVARHVLEIRRNVQPSMRYPPDRLGEAGREWLTYSAAKAAVTPTYMAFVGNGKVDKWYWRKMVFLNAYSVDCTCRRKGSVKISTCVGIELERTWSSDSSIAYNETEPFSTLRIIGKRREVVDVDMKVGTEKRFGSGSALSFTSASTPNLPACQDHATKVDMVVIGELK
ncbi:hypothetical protein BDQ17DRAFT_1329490 [Cyathus striatus]|nr:hypothetical protein BDQ17DRAFT_1329490 [Cyathus striatus]